ncbi:DUF2484 family protein [Sinisalibacter aestuarii]|uniref:DUF2484 family protein n=1 Tax=Sinisalibacter aestuarii TaxID=2949426 RepID=A0ABQ5LS87_9RHOB|nr:DUF2484 family protein [Sinisalibacter aestuarii]GKY87116.1 hypothetical protein STA1M1_09850 [Sinisalibacter aestuarii]
MTPSLIAAAFWVLLGAVTAFFPIRYQAIPGSVLLLTAVPLMIWVGYQNGWIWTALALFAFLSMFRRPLLYLIAKARGQNPERPT